MDILLSMNSPPFPAVVATICLLPVVVIVHRLFFHPLSRVPGPKVAAMTRLWYAYQVRKGRARELTQMLHKKYGPVVRVTPNMVWFNTEDGFQEVYRAGSPFGKSDWYYAVAAKHGPINWFPLKRAAPDTLDLVAEMDMPRYRMQRRLIGPTFAASNLLNHERAVDEVLQRFVSKLRELDGKEVDLTEWMHILAMECLTAVTFRWSPKLIEAETNYGTLMDGYFQFWRYFTVIGLFPRLTLLSSQMGVKSKRLLQRLVDTGVESCPKPLKNIWIDIGRQMMIQSAGNRDLQKEPTGSLADDLVRLHQAKPEFKQEYLTEMVASTIRAGGDTLTATLAAIVAQANLHPGVKARVTEEVAGVDSIASFHDGTNLPFTTATIKEAMRHWPVVGLAMYREVPKKGLTLNGHYIPPGTTVGCSPLALQRNEAIFGKDADEFIPDKWLEERYRIPLERYSLGFGSQNRSCPGRNISEQCIYKAFPTLMKHFDIEVEMPSEMLTYGTSIMTGVKAKFNVRRSVK